MDPAHKFKHWLLQAYPHSGLLLLALCALTALLLGYGLSHAQATQHRQHLLSDHAASLAKLAAKPLAIAMSDKDLISLQALTNELATQGLVTQALIYDLDNRILVKSSKPGISAQQQLSAPQHHQPISLDNSLLGALVIKLDDNSKASPSLGLLTLGLLALATAIYAAITLQRQGYAQASDKTDASQRCNKTPKVPDTQGDTPQTISRSNIAAPIETQLVIQLHGVDKLYQQLNSVTRQHQLTQMQTGLEQILSLYSGRQLATTPDSVLLSFSDKDATESHFKAICSAYLLSAMAREQHWLLHPTLIVYTQQHSPRIDTLLAQPLPNRPPENTPAMPVFITRDCLDTTALGTRLALTTQNQTTQHPGDLIELNGFSPRYTHLLQNQLQHLLDAAETTSHR
ncbi:MAG: hypothetical protein KTR20_11565 [Cellvibrionaceae bacterium]|nr:hypothetical protein [Cellvibrionaceae bacterium]